jgi:hypothetical protein
LLDGKVREERAEAVEVQPIVAPLPA